VTLEGASPAGGEPGRGDFRGTPAALLSALYLDLARGGSLSDALARLIHAMEAAIPGSMGSVMLLEQGRLRAAAGPSLPEGFYRAADGHPVGEGHGSCGTATYRREMVVVDDVMTNPLWETYRPIAERYGIGACWSVPLFHPASGEVLGSVATYFRRARQPVGTDLRHLQEHAEMATGLIDCARLRTRIGQKDGRFADLVDDLGALAWEASGEEVHFSSVSPQAEQALGQAAGSLVDDPGAWTRLIHPDDRDVVLRRQREAARQGGDYEYEHRLQGNDGRTLWVRNLVSVQQTGASGRHLRGVMIDISGQREIERERERLVRHLADERSLLRSVLEQLPEPVMIVGVDGEILIANQALMQLLNMPVRTDVHMQDEFKDFVGLFPDGRRYEIEDWPMSRVLATGEAIKGAEMDYVAADGLLRSMIIGAAPIRDTTGAMIAGVSVLEDVTERRRADRRQRLLVEAGALLAGSREGLLTARRVAALAVEQFAEWVAIVTASDEGELACTVLEHRDSTRPLNRGAIDHQLADPGPGFLRVRTVIESGVAVFSPLSAGRDGATLASDESGAAEMELARLLQTLGGTAAITVPLTSPTRVMGAMIFAAGPAGGGLRASDMPVVEELSRRVALSLENARLFSDAETAIRHREEFLSIAAHELRTPLASLRLTVQTIDDQLSRPKLDLAFLRARAKAGERYTGRLDRLIRELLDVAVIQTGRLRLAHEEIDLMASAENVISCLRDDLTLKGIDLVLHGQGPIVGWWDAARIEQVMTNLLSNAIKYGNGLPLRVFLEADAETATFQVEDEGMGIAPEILPRLFRPFERGVSPGHFGGLGLGLHISDQIVRAHGGAISVRSTLDQGSTFTVRLPRRMPS
jgi:PAS domain S-box-containing protein